MCSSVLCLFLWVWSTFVTFSPSRPTSCSWCRHSNTSLSPGGKAGGSIRRGGDRVASAPGPLQLWWPRRPAPVRVVLPAFPSPSMHRRGEQLPSRSTTRAFAAGGAWLGVERAVLFRVRGGSWFRTGLRLRPGPGFEGQTFGITLSASRWCWGGGCCPGT